MVRNISRGSFSSAGFQVNKNTKEDEEDFYKTLKEFLEKAQSAQQSTQPQQKSDISFNAEFLQSILEHQEGEDEPEIILNKISGWNGAEPARNFPPPPDVLPKSADTPFTRGVYNRSADRDSAQRIFEKLSYNKQIENLINKINHKKRLKFITFNRI